MGDNDEDDGDVGVVDPLKCNIDSEELKSQKVISLGGPYAMMNKVIGVMARHQYLKDFRIRVRLTTINPFVLMPKWFKKLKHVGFQYAMSQKEQPTWYFNDWKKDPKKKEVIIFPPLAYVAPLAWMNLSQAGGSGKKWNDVLSGQKTIDGLRKQHKKLYNTTEDMRRLSFKESEYAWFVDYTKRNLQLKETWLKEPALTSVAKQITTWHIVALPNFLALNPLAKKELFDPNNPKHKMVVDWRAEDEFGLYAGYTWLGQEFKSENVRSICGFKLLSFSYLSCLSCFIFVFFVCFHVFI